jgi:hypothetical protein
MLRNVGSRASGPRRRSASRRFQFRFARTEQSTGRGHATCGKSEPLNRDTAITAESVAAESEFAQHDPEHDIAERQPEYDEPERWKPERHKSECAEHDHTKSKYGPDAAKYDANAESECTEHASRPDAAGKSAAGKSAAANCPAADSWNCSASGNTTLDCRIFNRKSGLRNEPAFFWLRR